jgi:dTDP-4-dehydrorhamnose reductase
MTRFLVTGASGLLGLNFALQTTEQHEVIAVVHQHGLNHAPFPVLKMDLSLPGEVERLLLETRPDVIINCAAYANVDICEAEPERAYYLNAVVPGALARAAAHTGTYLVHISTDGVFDGLRGDYCENDPTSPINQYARTKVAGERAVMASNPDALIARVDFYGWSLRGQRSLAEHFYNNLSAGQTVKGFTDVFFCPLEVNDLVDVLYGMIEQRLNGIYHVVSSECISKYEFGRRIARLFGFDENRVQPVSWKDGDLVAPRAPNLSLNVEKLTGVLGCRPPEQEIGLQRFLELHQYGYPQRLKLMGQSAA